MTHRAASLRQLSFSFLSCTSVAVLILNILAWVSEGFTPKSPLTTFSHIRLYRSYLHGDFALMDFTGKSEFEIMTLPASVILLENM